MSKSNRIQWLLAILGSTLLLTWLTGGAFVAWRKGAVERKQRQRAELQKRAELVKAGLEEIEWMVVYHFKWSHAIGNALGGAENRGEKVKWEHVLEAAQRHERERNFSLLTDRWGRPVKPWIMDGELLAVISAGEDGEFEDGEGDDIWIGVTDEMFERGRARLDEKIRQKGEALELQ